MCRVCHREVNIAVIYCGETNIFLTVRASLSSVSVFYETCKTLVYSLG